MELSRKRDAKGETYAGVSREKLGVRGQRGARNLQLGKTGRSSACAKHFPRALSSLIYA